MKKFLTLCTVLTLALAFAMSISFTACNNDGGGNSITYKSTDDIDAVYELTFTISSDFVEAGDSWVLTIHSDEPDFTRRGKVASVADNEINLGDSYDIDRLPVTLVATITDGKLVKMVVTYKDGVTPTQNETLTPVVD